MDQVIDLPLVLLGEKIEIDGQTDVETISYESGLTIRLPKVTPEHIEKLRQSSNSELKKMSLPEITIFLQKVGYLWQNPDYELRKKAIEISSKITGFDECFIARDFDVITGYAATRPEMFDQINAELGSYHILDEWLPREECYHHAEPRGKVFHVMVGNIPIASMFSVIRGILTKNMNIAKLPSRDVSSYLFFILSFLDVDPNHPITKSLSALYWTRGNSEIEDPIIQMSDVVCVWGGEEAVNAIKPKIPSKTEFIEFGPKRSLSIIDLDRTDDYFKTACRLACDMSIYNQEACFSSQIAFIKGGRVDEFIENLKYWLDINSKRWPKGFMSFDNNAHISINKLKEIFSGHQVITSKDNEWCLIKCNDINYKPTHPLGRTMYIYVIDDILQVMNFIDREVQTAGVFPWEVGFEYKDKFAEQGLDRICELGAHTLPRVGFSHDSILPLSRMVRIISLERSIAYKGKYLDYTPEDEYLYFGYYTNEDELKKLLQERVLPNNSFIIPKGFLDE